MSRTFYFDDVRLLTGSVSSAHHGQRRYMSDGSDGRRAHPRGADYAAYQIDAIHQHDVHMEAAALLQFAFLFRDYQPVEDGETVELKLSSLRPRRTFAVNTAARVILLNGLPTVYTESGIGNISPAGDRAVTKTQLNRFFLLLFLVENYELCRYCAVKTDVVNI